MTRLLIGATVLALASQGLVAPSGLIVPRRFREAEPEPATEQEPAGTLGVLDVDAITTAHEKRARKAGKALGLDLLGAAQMTIAVSVLGGEKPARFETEVGTIFLISRDSWAEMVKGIETNEPTNVETEEGSADTSGVLATLNGVPVIDLDAETERAVAVGIALSKTMQAMIAKSRPAPLVSA